MKGKVFFKNFTAGRKALFTRIGVCLGSALAVHQIAAWIMETNAVADFLKSVSYKTVSLFDVLSQPWIYFAVAMLCAIFSQYKFAHFDRKIENGTDCSIEISMNDIFKNKGQILVPSNSIFASDLNIIGGESIQAQMVKRMNVKKKTDGTAEEYITKQIRDALQCDEYKTARLEGEYKNLNGKEYQVYKYGTIVPVKADINNKTRDILLLAMSSISSEGVPVVDRETLLKNIDKMWDYIASHHTSSSTVVVPIMGTGAARVPMEKQVVARYILYSFAERSQELGIKKLVLSVYPGDYVNNSIDLNELRNYASFLCKFPNTDFKI